MPTVVLARAPCSVALVCKFSYACRNVPSDKGGIEDLTDVLNRIFATTYGKLQWCMGKQSFATIRYSCNLLPVFLQARASCQQWSLLQLKRSSRQLLL